MTRLTRNTVKVVAIFRNQMNLMISATHTPTVCVSVQFIYFHLNFIQSKDIQSTDTSAETFISQFRT